MKRSWSVEGRRKKAHSTSVSHSAPPVREVVVQPLFLEHHDLLDGRRLLADHQITVDNLDKQAVRASGQGTSEHSPSLVIDQKTALAFGRAATLTQRILWGLSTPAQAAQCGTDRRRPSEEPPARFRNLRYRRQQALWTI